MNTLKSFPTDLRVAVIGASGGIGSALVEFFAAHPRVATVYAFSRRIGEDLAANVVPAELDLTDEASIKRGVELVAAESPLDIVLVASGILWSGEDLRPEKNMRELDSDKFSEVFAINTTGPALVAKHFLPSLRKGSKTVFAALSARVGSIGDNRLGGWYAYRASKAALNMVLKTLAIEQARLWPEAVVVGLHPGTVDTPLSSPYSSRTPPEKLFSATRSARYLADVIETIGPQDTGGVFAWDGARIEC